MNEPNHIAAKSSHLSSIPRFDAAGFDAKSFDVKQVLRAAQAAGKSAYEVLEEAGYPVAKALFEVSVKKASDGSETIDITASTTADDLSGDVILESAQRQMLAASPGSTIFLNHSYNLPEDVFGVVMGAELIKRDALYPQTTELISALCLDLAVRPVTEQEFPRAAQVASMVRSGVRLGASVTILILKSKKASTGERQISDVYYIETSLVGVPCNQLSWAHASKQSDQPSKSLNPTESENQVMKDPNIETVNADLAAKASVEAPHSDTPVEAVAPAVEASPARKGLFATELEERTNSIYALWDTFWSALSKLRCLAAAAEGTSVDVAAEASMLVSEFAAALLPLVEAEAVVTNDDNMIGFYAAPLAALQGIVQKSGARHSAQDRQALEDVHTKIAKMIDAPCAKDLSADESGDEKQASIVAVLSDLQTKVAAFDADRATFASQLAEKQAECDAREATSIALLTALKSFSREQLPRAGVTAK